MAYRKINRQHVSFGRVEALKKAGLATCDAVAHNSYRGCPNPKCWNHIKKKAKKV